MGASVGRLGESAALATTPCRTVQKEETDPSVMDGIPQMDGLWEKLRVAEETLAFQKEQGDKAGQAAAWLTVAQLCLENEAHDRALKAAKNARAFAREVGDEVTLTNAS